MVGLAIAIGALLGGLREENGSFVPDTSNGQLAVSSSKKTETPSSDDSTSIPSKSKNTASTTRRPLRPPVFTGAKLAVPVPEAYKAIDSRTANLVDVFNSEERNPVWAPAMENAVTNILNPRKFREIGLEGVSLHEIECRGSSCRLEIDYPVSLIQGLPLQSNGKRSSPVGIINLKTDALGAVDYTTRTEYFAKAGAAYERKAIVVAYDEETIDPALLLRRERDSSGSEAKK